MSIEKINLRKLLRLFFADARQQRSLLLEDLRTDEARESGPRESGGDFFGPFWADVKGHAAGLWDLRERTQARIAAKNGRTRLYPILTECFFEMWNEKMRWRNEPFEFVPESIKAQLVVEALGATVKIENTVGIKRWDGSYRIMYPYFSERPALPEEGARLGFWVLQKTLPQYEIDVFRIIDFHRRTYYQPAEVGMKGDEEKQFIERYDALLRQWRKLRDER